MIGPTFLLPVAGPAMPADGAPTTVEGGEDFPTALLAATLLGGSDVMTPDLPEANLVAAPETSLGPQVPEGDVEELEEGSAATAEAQPLVAAVWQPLAGPPAPQAEADVRPAREELPVNEISAARPGVQPVVEEVEDLAVVTVPGDAAVFEVEGDAPISSVDAVFEVEGDSPISSVDAAPADAPSMEPVVAEPAEAPAEIPRAEAPSPGGQDSSGRRGFEGSGSQHASYEIGSPAGPSSSKVDSAGAPTAQQSSQAARRVMGIVERLENQPPPRQMVVELPELEGLRLQVSLRAGGVHVSVLEGGSSAQLRPLSIELAQNLAERGFELADFSDADRHKQQEREEQPTEAFTSAARTAGRARKSDSQLRL